MKILAVITSLSFMWCASFQYPVHHRKLRTLQESSYRRLNSHFTYKKDSDRNINSEPSPEESDNTADISVKGGPSHKRIGGRRKDVQRRQVRSFLPLSLGGFLDKYRKFIIWTLSAFLVGAIVFGQLFNFNAPSYVYYQSSVIESRILGFDGNVQTSRKETFKSNIPDLVRERQKQSLERSSISTDTTYSQNSLIRSEERRFSEEMDQFEKSSSRIRSELDSSVQADLKLLMDEFF
jgi:hypothetical protein